MLLNIIDGESQDYNRQRVLERNSIISILKLVYDPQLTDTAIPVLYNICTDYGKRMPAILQSCSANRVREPAQQQAANDGTVSVLVRILQSGDYAWDPLLSYLWQLLEYTTSPREFIIAKLPSIDLLMRW